MVLEAKNGHFSCTVSRSDTRQNLIKKLSPQKKSTVSAKTVIFKLSPNASAYADSIFLGMSHTKRSLLQIESAKSDFLKKKEGESQMGERRKNQDGNTTV